MRGDTRPPAPAPLRILTIVALAALLALSSGCGDGTAERAGQVIVTGSTTILPIAEVAASEFDDAHAGAKVLVSGAGSSEGIANVSSGVADIGTSSRDLKPEEEGLGLVDTPIAYDAIAVIVNPSNPVRSLTKQQVKDVFQGRVTNWSELGGPDLEIGLVNRDEASGTREAFGKLVLDKEAFDQHAVVLPGTGQVRSVVSQSRGAVGYISLGFITDEVAPVAIDGVVPTVEAAIDGTYKVRRLLHFFTKGEPSGLTKEFVDYMLSPAVQNGAVEEAGFIPVAEARR